MDINDKSVGQSGGSFSTNYNEKAPRAQELKAVDKATRLQFARLKARGEELLRDYTPLESEKQSDPASVYRYDPVEKLYYRIKQDPESGQPKITFYKEGEIAGEGSFGIVNILTPIGPGASKEKALKTGAFLSYEYDISSAVTKDKTSMHVLQIKSAITPTFVNESGESKQSSICIIMPKFDLSLDHLNDKTIEKLKPHRVEFLRQMLAGVAEMHVVNSAHCDIADRNFLLRFDKQGAPHVVLADFGKSKNLEVLESLYRDKAEQHLRSGFVLDLRHLANLCSSMHDQFLKPDEDETLNQPTLDPVDQAIDDFLVILHERVFKSRQRITNTTAQELLQQFDEQMAKFLKQT